jgi:hypothetical protein
LVDVVATGSYLGERARVETPFVLGKGDDGVDEGGLRRSGLPCPGLEARGGVEEEPGGPVLPSSWQMTLEDVGGLDDVVVDANEDQVVHLHELSLLGNIVHPAPASSRSLPPGACESLGHTAHWVSGCRERGRG